MRYKISTLDDRCGPPRRTFNSRTEAEIARARKERKTGETHHILEGKEWPLCWPDHFDARRVA